MTAQDAVNEFFIPSAKDTIGTGWKERHQRAAQNPTGNQVSAMIAGFLVYATQHESRFESSIGEDRILGPAWAEIGKSLLVLLNGEIGGLDAGTCDKAIRIALESQGTEMD